MSKARLVITAVTVEKRSVSEVARTYGVARSWVYALLAIVLAANAVFAFAAISKLAEPPRGPTPR